MNDEATSELRYEVIFAGTPAEGFDVITVKENIRQRFGLSEERLDLLFSGKRFSIRKGLSWDEAWLYRQRMRVLGANCQVVPLSSGATTQGAKQEFPCPQCKQPASGDICGHCGFDLGRHRENMQAKGFVETPGGFIRERRAGDRRSGIDRRGEIRYEEGRRSGLDRRASQSTWDRI